MVTMRQGAVKHNSKPNTIVCGLCCVCCRDPQLNAGKRIAQIVRTVPFTEEEVVKKWETLPPPDGQLSSFEG